MGGHGRSTAVRTAALVGVGVVMACAAEPPLQEDRVVATPILPVQVGEWRGAEEWEIYDPETIFSYIDGHAEVFLAYGMKRCLARRYAGPEGEPDIVVDLYEVGSPADAFGVFSNDQDGEAVEVGQGAFFRSGWLSFWQGSWFGSVYAEGESEGSKNAVLALGRAAAAAVGETGEPPTLVGALPLHGLEPRTVRYLHAQEILNGVVYLGYENPFLLAPEVDAVVGSYRIPEGAGWLLIVDYPDETTAVRANERVAAAGISASRQGSRLTAVLAPESAGVTEVLFAEASGGSP